MERARLYAVLAGRIREQMTSTIDLVGLGDLTMREAQIRLRCIRDTATRMASGLRSIDPTFKPSRFLASCEPVQAPERATP